MFLSYIDNELHWYYLKEIFKSNWWDSILIAVLKIYNFFLQNNILGWKGKHCEQICDNSTYGPDCEGICSCQNGATCSPVNGFCNCPNGFKGFE